MAFFYYLDKKMATLDGGSMQVEQINNHQAQNNDHQTNNGTEEPPTIDIAINNVVACFATRCHLDLRTIAMEGTNVEYRRENGVGIWFSAKCRNLPGLGTISH